MNQNNLITAALFTPSSLQFPNSWVGHMPFAAWVIQEISPKIFVELGTHTGNSYFSFCQSVIEAGTSSKCYAVDTWQGDEHAGQYDEEIFAKVDAHHQERYAGFSRLLRMTFDDAATYFAEESIGLLHIDGLHTYEAVRHDFETWLPKLAPGAVVMFHDTNVRERNFGVWKLWQELQADHPNNLEFVHSHGLGVLQLNNAPDDKRLEWLQPGSPDKQFLINYFAALGSRQLERYELNELKQHAANLNQIIAERDGQIANLNQAIAERDGQIASLTQTVAERDGQIADLNQTVTERDGQIADLNQAVAERDGQIASLTQTVIERDGHIDSLNQASAERDGQRASLTQIVAERDGQIASLNQTIAECEWQIAELRTEIVSREEWALKLDQHLKIAQAHYDHMASSTSWRISLPLREAKRFFIYSPEQQAKRYVRKSLRLARRMYQALPLSCQTKEVHRNTLAKYLPRLLLVSGSHPATHILRDESQKDHISSQLEMDICGDYDFKTDRETILVVSHEASRTGAPILSLNLVQALVGQYNVVALLLGGGPLSDAFKLSGAAVLESFYLRGNPGLANDIVSQLCARFNFKFALVNSIESRVVLPPLGDYFIPVISLIHEFASYTRPRNAFRDALFWSGEVVFSANVTMENALAEFPDLSDRSAHILPQGRCLLPLAEFSEEQLQAESTHIHRLIRPKGLAEDTVVVLGAGTVQIRKGVDLFIECAARVVHALDGNRCRFVWIGNGYDPDNDVGYSVYLADQIRRADLQEHVIFVGETAAIETAYKEADLLLLSSRLDPLPNVAIDAMAHGLPVLCFDKTTGIADFLIESGLRSHCVAEYLDSSNMAKKILELAGSQALRKDVAEQCRAASMAYFNMAEYVASLEVLAKRVCECTQQEKVDMQTILGSGLFRRDFSCPPYQQDKTIEDEVRFYVRAWASGINRRKPFPGFHPGIYLEQHGVAIPGADPFADYLRAGQPEGPWNYPVIVAQKTTAEELSGNHRVALHLHIYYPELLPEIVARLAYNRICPDLFVSITNEEARDSVVNDLKDYKGKIVDIQLVPNRGRDIGPFLTAFGQRLLANYDFVGHLHTKKSVAIKDASMGESWRQFLLENLLGGESGSMADSILARMKDDASIGMVFPDDPYSVGWGANLAFAEPLAAQIGLEKLPEHFVFPVGTMFWAKASALAPLINLDFGWDDYPEEPLPYDGTLLHAIERLVSLTLSLGNLGIAATNVIGLTR